MRIMNKKASSIASAIFLLIFLICGIFSVCCLLVFLRALETGHFFAVLYLLFGVISGAISLIGLFIAKAFNRMSPEEVKAFEGYRTLAEKGDREAQFSLGLRYDNGEGVAKDEVEAVKWYRKAADQGHAKAQFNLGTCYRNGEGVAKDEIEAYAYYNLAGITNENARKNLAILEKGMSPDARLRGQQRSKELQKEIETKIAAKQAEDVKKAGK